MERAVEYVTFGGGRSVRTLTTLVAEFITFHLMASSVLTLLAIWLCGHLQKQTYGQTVRNANRFRRLRPGLGNWPLLWKEVCTEAAAGRGWFAGS